MYSFDDLCSHRHVQLSGGAQVRDQLDVRDAASALATLVEDEGAAGAVNVCSGVPLTLRELLTTLADMLGRSAAVRFGARAYAPNEIMHLVGDPTRLKALGWELAHSDLRGALGDHITSVRAR